MYSSKPTIVYGFHGLDKDVAIKILNQESEFKHSNNKYDWLGNGVYFWENNLERAHQYALQTVDLQAKLIHCLHRILIRFTQPLWA
jgi:hypothetical protein